MSEYIQKGYIHIADIIPIWDDIRIADIPTLSERTVNVILHVIGG